MSSFSRSPRPSVAGVLLFGILVSIAGTNMGAQGQELAAQMPETLHLPGLNHPMWVSSAAAGEDSGIRWEMFDKYARESLRHEAEQIAAELARRGDFANKLTPVLDDAPYLDESLCVTSAVVFGHRDEEAPRDNFADLNRHAFAVFSGRVVAISQGFMAGHPASLLKVEVRSVHSGEKELSGLNHLYVSYPYAAFALDEKVFCRQDPRYSYRPRMGDQVVLFPAQRPVDRDGSLLVIEPEEIFAQQDAAGLFIPRNLAEDPDLESIQKLDSLRALLPLAEKRGVGSKGGQ